MSTAASRKAPSCCAAAPGRSLTVPSTELQPCRRGFIALPRSIEHKGEILSVWRVEAAKEEDKDRDNKE